MINVPANDVTEFTVTGLISRPSVAIISNLWSCIVNIPGQTVQNALIIRIRYRLSGSTSIISKVVFVVVPVSLSYKKLSIGILYNNIIKIDTWYYMKDTI